MRRGLGVSPQGAGGPGGAVGVSLQGVEPGAHEAAGVRGRGPTVQPLPHGTPQTTCPGTLQAARGDGEGPARVPRPTEPAVTPDNCAPARRCPVHTACSSAFGHLHFAESFPPLGTSRLQSPCPASCPPVPLSTCLRPAPPPSQPS